MWHIHAAAHHLVTNAPASPGLDRPGQRRPRHRAGALQCAPAVPHYGTACSIMQLQHASMPAQTTLTAYGNMHACSSWKAVMACSREDTVDHDDVPADTECPMPPGSAASTARKKDCVGGLSASVYCMPAASDMHNALGCWTTLVAYGNMTGLAWLCQGIKPLVPGTASLKLAVANSQSSTN